LWDDDELMTLIEAVALYWPDGPLTETSLRTAARDGRLPISQVAGKFFVTRTALRSLTVCAPLQARAPGNAPAPTDRGYQADLAEIAEMKRRSKRDGGH
jgi:hypothetical protein